MEATKNLADGINQAYEHRNFPWDFYFMAMAEADWRAGRADLPATKSFYIRNAPFGGSYCLLGGITEALVTIKNLDFLGKDFYEGAVHMGSSPDFVNWLAVRERLRVRVLGGREGTVFFPNEPIVTVQGPLADIRLVEGILTYALNFPSLALTKWYRIVRSARPGVVLDASLRRDQDSRRASLGAMSAGCVATSNCDFAGFFDVKVAGTMGHEWPMSFGDIPLAFDKWLECHPNRPVGLVDTLQCMEHDFPAWLEAVYKHRDRIKEANPPFWGWRNDSGDLGYYSVEQYRRAMQHPLTQDPWFRDRMRIVLANELDEYTITNISNQIRDDVEPTGLDANEIKSRILWMVGTKAGVCYDQPSLGGVAKLMECDDCPTLKPALDSDGHPGPKTSIPGFNLSCLVPNGDDSIACCLIYPAHRYTLVSDGAGGWSLHNKKTGETPKTIIAMHKDSSSSFMELKNQGLIAQQDCLYDSTQGASVLGDAWLETLDGVSKRIEDGIGRLHFTMTSRLVKPHSMKVSVTPDLFELRDSMLKNKTLMGKKS
jgi:nicotinate phosphoribosyltransferase